MVIFFSNSFIIEEQKILCYLIMGIVGIVVFDIIKHSFRFDNRNRVKISTFLKSVSFKVALAGAMAIILLRTSYNLFRCREEQTNCADFQTAGNTMFRKGGRGNIYFLSVAATCLYTLRGVLQTCRNIWVKFYPNQMKDGLLVTFLPLFFTFLLIVNSKQLRNGYYFATNFL
uniref:Uncharacterized protein n=1 Tax=Megaselia scalaris TaxID=36166 RepID=T1GE51_MEGSC